MGKNYSGNESGNSDDYESLPTIHNKKTGENIPLKLDDRGTPIVPADADTAENKREAQKIRQYEEMFRRQAENEAKKLRRREQKEKDKL